MLKILGLPLSLLLLASISHAKRVEVDPMLTSNLVDGQNAYVVNYSNNTVSNCPINSDGSFGTCSVLDAGGILNNPANIVFHPAGTFAYITNLAIMTEPL